MGLLPETQRPLGVTKGTALETGKVQDDFILKNKQKQNLCLIWDIAGIYGNTPPLLRNSAMGLEGNLRRWPCHISLSFEHSTAKITWRNKGLLGRGRGWGKLEGGAGLDQEQTKPTSLSLLLFSAISHHYLASPAVNGRGSAAEVCPGQTERHPKVRVRIQWVSWGIVWD